MVQGGGSSMSCQPSALSEQHENSGHHPVFHSISSSRPFPSTLRTRLASSLPAPPDPSSNRWRTVRLQVGQAQSAYAPLYSFLLFIHFFAFLQLLPFPSPFSFHFAPPLRRAPVGPASAGRTTPRRTEFLSHFNSSTFPSPPLLLVLTPNKLHASTALALAISRSSSSALSWRKR